MNIKRLQKISHQICVEKGFWSYDFDCPSCFGKKKRLKYYIAGKLIICPECKGIGKSSKDRNNGELIALMHSELSEALEELRKKDCNMKLVGEELADCVIRIMDFCQARGIDLEKEILRKIKKNRKRPRKHGKRF